MTYVIMPYRGNLDQTRDAIGAVLTQTLDVRLLLICTGGEPIDPPYRGATPDPRVLHWHHNPALPSLAATWNCALEFAWAAGTHEAFVFNNDIRVPNGLCAHLLRGQQQTGAWFISACNVGDQYAEAIRAPLTDAVFSTRGGPDFSCFLITRECHTQFPFDKNFQPAYCEDLDYHRHMMLAGKGDRIFSVPIPYLHYASGTLKALPDAQRLRLESQISAGSRAYYQQKWGGPPNQETYAIPFDPASAREGVTTPDLQHRGVPT